MFQHLLVPLDGTKLAEAALPAAAFLAERANARVTLLHVVERDPPATVHGHRHLSGADEAEAYLREAAGRCFPPGVQVAWHVHREGTPDVPRSLADHAGELAPDLIVMLSHGDKTIIQRILGSVPQQVVRHGSVPVLLLRPTRSGAVALPFRQVLVPLDGRPEHEAGLAPAADLARLCDAPVRLLMVVPTGGTLAGPHAATGQLLPFATGELLDQAEENGARYLEGQVARLLAEGLPATATVARGEPMKAIINAAADTRTDLVALGTHGAAGTEAFWTGSLGARLIRRVHASFLLAPAKRA
jgi:nucleotide-binding universal stress UspA family protein